MAGYRHPERIRPTRLRAGVRALRASAPRISAPERDRKPENTLVTAGENKRPGERQLIDDRKTLRNDPPDILLTNYRMLDFLLMRPEDAWRQRDLDLEEYKDRYVEIGFRLGTNNAAYAPGFPLELPGGQGRGFVLKLSSEGEHLWTKRLFVAGVGVDPEGNIYASVAGEEPAAEGYSSGAQLLKLDPDGGVLWSKPIGLPASYQGNDGYDTHIPGSVAVSADGSTVYASAELGDSLCDRMCSYLSVVTHFSSDGERGEAFFPSGDEDAFGFGAQRLVASADGSSVFVMGLQTSIGRYDRGATEPGWVYRQGVQGDGSYTSSFALDPNGDLFVAGSITVGGLSDDNQTDWWVRSIDGETGDAR